MIKKGNIPGKLRSWSNLRQGKTVCLFYFINILEPFWTATLLFKDHTDVLFKKTSQRPSYKQTQLFWCKRRISEDGLHCCDGECDLPQYHMHYGNLWAKGKTRLTKIMNSCTQLRPRGKPLK